MKPNRCRVPARPLLDSRFQFRRFASAAAIAALLSAASVSAEQSTTRTRPLPVVAVLDFQSSTLPSGQSDAFAHAVWSEIHRSPATRVLPRKQARQYLYALDLYPGLAYGPRTPMRRVAEALRADFVVTGNVNHIGAAYSFDFEIYSLALNDAYARRGVIERGEMDELFLQAPSLAGAILDAIDRVERAMTSGAFREPAPTPPTGAAPPAPRQVPESAALPEKASEAPATIAHPTAAAPIRSEPIESDPAQLDDPASIDPPKPPAEVARPPITPPAESLPPIDETDRREAADAFERAQSLPGDSPERLPLLERAAALDKSEPQYAEQLASAYYAQKDMERVVRVCRESLRFHPRHAVFHTILGAAYHVQEEYEAAEAELEIVLAMNPSDLYALYNRAIVLQAQGSPETVAAWEEYLRKSDGDAEHTAPLPDRPGGLSRRDIARAYYQQVKGDVPRR